MVPRPLLGIEGEAWGWVPDREPAVPLLPVLEGLPLLKECGRHHDDTTDVQLYTVVSGLHQA